ncbi:MAG TPA: PQQ-binding-like beta-propeller repeat protein [Chthoniobacter sp.]
MKLRRSLRPLNSTFGAVVAPLLIAGALCPKSDDSSRNLPHAGESGLPAEAGVRERPADAPFGNGTSFVRGGIEGVLTDSASARDEMPNSGEGLGNSAFDREFADLLDALHKGSHPGREGRSVFRAMADFWGPSTPDNLGERTIQDSKFGVVSRSVAERLGWTNFSSPGRENGRAEASRLRDFKERLLADLERAAPPTEFPSNSDYSLAPIGVNTSTSDGGSLVVSGYPLASGTAPATGNGYLPPSPSWSSLPVPTTASASDNNSSSLSFGSVVITAPLSSPPNWKNYAPSVPAANFPSMASVASVPVVTPNAPAVPVLVPALTTLTARSTTPAILTASSTAPASASTTGTAIPQIPNPSSFIYVANAVNNTDGFVTAYNATTGTVVPAFTTITGPSNYTPDALAANTSFLYVGDLDNATVKAYNASSGTLYSNFATISGYVPEGLVLSKDGSTLYLAEGTGNAPFTGAGVIAYNALTGAQLSTFAMISTPYPYALAVSSNGADLYVGDYHNGTVKEYNASTGALIPSFSLSVPNVSGLAISANGQDIFVTDANTVTEYSLSTGDQVAFTLSPAPGSPASIATFGNALYVGDQNLEDVVEYSQATGVEVSTSTFDITSVNATALAVIPEPSSVLLLLGAGAMLGLRRRRRGQGP